MRRLACALAFAVLAAATPAAAQESGPRPFNARDLNMLDRVSDPRIAPDGRRVLYSLRTTDWEANRGRNALWLVDQQGGAPRRLAISEGGASAGRWGPDGSIWFMSSRGGSN